MHHLRAVAIFKPAACEVERSLLYNRGRTDDKVGNTKYLLVRGYYANGLIQKDAIDKVRAKVTAAGNGGSAVSDREDVFDNI